MLSWPALLADETTTPLIVGGGALGILGFVLALVKVWSSDRVWRNLIEEIRDELRDCREGRLAQTTAHANDRSTWNQEKASLQQEVKTLTGEVISLRRMIHTDMWMGTDPDSVREKFKNGEEV
jgi:hypothetical protein